MRPGEIYWADLASGRRPAIVVSREELNRGSYVVAVLCTTSQFTTRAALPNCVAFHVGEFGLPRDCVAQCEAITFIDQTNLDLATGVLGTLDATRLRDLIKAVGYVLESDCEPA